MSGVPADASPVGFVASETSKSNELETSAERCARTGQILVISSDKAITLAHELQTQYPALRIRVDVGSWRSTYATAAAPLDDVSNIFGEAGWYEMFPSSGGIEVYTPSRFVRPSDRDSRRVLIEQTADLPPNVITRIATDASVLEASNRDDFFEDLSAASGRRLAFTFASDKDPLASYQRLSGLRQLLVELPGCEIDHVDPLVAADALAHGAGFVGVGASSARRMPKRPDDPNTGFFAVGALPGLFLEPLLEMRSPMVYLYWYANSPSPYCTTCDRRLDMFEPTPGDKALIVGHNLHQTTDHIAALMAQAPLDRPAWLRRVRLDAHARHVKLNPTRSGQLNLSLHRFLELDDPEMREMTRAGEWKA